MKKLVVLSLLTLCLNAEAQTETIDTTMLVATYGYQVSTQDETGNAVTDLMQVAVQVGRQITKSMPMSEYLAAGGEPASVERAWTEASMHMPTIWINYPDGQTTSRELIFPSIFEGTEATPRLAWALTDDTLTIAGYLCHAATLSFRGITWHAWYTEEIPSSAGPWRLHGLPGLIVKAESSAHLFTLSGVKQITEPITFSHDATIHRMKYTKLLKYRNEIYGNAKYPANPTWYIPDLKAILTEVNVLNINGKPSVIANDMPLLSKAHVYQPLEMK